MHPDKKWPSISISLFLVATLGLLSYLNTASYNTQHLANQQNSINKEASNIKSVPQLNVIKYTPSKKTLTQSTVIDINNNILTASNAPNQKLVLSKNTNTPKKVLTANILIQKYISSTNAYAIVPTNLKIIETEKANSYTSTKDFSSNDMDFTSIKNRETKIFNGYNIDSTSNNTAREKTITIVADKDKKWADNYTLYHNPLKNIGKRKISYEIYATPNLSFRKLSVQTKNNANSTMDIDNTVNQQPSLGFETGLATIYPVSKKIRLKAGVQFNYTNYAITAYDLNHPVVTTLTMNDDNSDYSYLETRVSTLANTTNSQSKKIHNKTYQASIPVGIEYKLIGSKDFQWYAGASIQPTYLFAGNAYLISSDTKNYVKDGSLLRKWQLNSALETFVTYKTKNDIRVQFGPQYRYQLSSTYKKYSISENLYQLGVKFGIIKDF